MKLILKIFNFVIMGLSLLATIFLFAMPSLSFNSKVCVDVKTFSSFVPKTDYTDDVDIVQLIGTDEIQVKVKFKLGVGDLKSTIKGDRDNINEQFINDNVKDIAGILHEPVNLITDFTIRGIIKKTIQEEIKTQVAQAAQKYGSSTPAEDIMDEVGMDDAYFTNFAYELYDSANKDTSTVDSVSQVLYEQIDDAIAKAEDSGAVDTTSYTEETKAQVKTNLVQILDQLKLVEDGGHLKKIGDIAYVYLNDYLKKGLDGKVAASELEQKSGEATQDYTDRLLVLYVGELLPDVAYKVVGIVTTILFIGLFIFAAIWVLLLVITGLRTFFGKKPWTIFGPWFWLIGSLQLILGFGLTFAATVILPKYKLPLGGFPIKEVLIAPRTYALAPSIIFLIMIGVAIAYAIIKGRVKKEIKAEAAQEGGKK